MAGLLEIPYLDFITLEDLIPKSPKRMAEDRNWSGNRLYKLNDYDSALAMYDEAIKLCPEDAAYYGKRSACYMMLGMYKEALHDAQKAVQLNSMFTKGYIRIAKCCIALGDTLMGEKAIRRANELGGAECTERESFALKAFQNLYEDAQKAMGSGDYPRVIFSMDLCLDHYPSNFKAKLIKAECLAMLGRWQEAQDIANDCSKLGLFDTEAMYLRGLCLYFEEKNEEAFKLLQEILRLDPDHERAMELYKKGVLLKQTKEEGNKQFKMGRWQQALNLYNEALTIDKNNRTVNAKLYFNKATVCSKLNQTKEAVEACTAALELDENYVKALLRRAKSFTELGEYEEAVKDYERLYEIDKRKENKQLLHEAKITLEKFKSNDYYIILGVEKSASEKDIKKAYRNRALFYHPDRHLNEPEHVWREKERRFKQVGEAYAILNDPKKRASYDRQ